MDPEPPRLLPRDVRRDLLTALHDAGNDPSPEDIALLAEGRLDRVPPAQRDALLTAVATDPYWSDVVRDLRAEAASERTDSTEPPKPGVIGRVDARGAAGPLGTFMKYSRWVGSAGAIAACYTVAMVAWRFADPPLPPPPTGVRSGNAGGADFPWRDLLTVLFAMLTLMLLAVWTLQALIAFRHLDD